MDNLTPFSTDPLSTLHPSAVDLPGPRDEMARLAADMANMAVSLGVRKYNELPSLPEGWRWQIRLEDTGPADEVSLHWRFEAERDS